MRAFEIVLLLVVVATAVAAFARRLRVPAPSLLVVAGVAVASIPGVPEVRVAPDVVSFAILPPLLYAAGQDLPWRELRSVWRPVSALAVGLVVSTAGAIGAVVAAMVGVPVSVGLVLGAVLASTDPVAVTALGRRLALPPRVHTLLQAESLFNDATSLVLVRVAVAIVAVGGATTWWGGVSRFAVLGGGGAAVGVAAAALAWLVERRTEDPVLETVVALITPYAAFVLAESAHVSGVTAVVVASVILASTSNRIGGASTRLQIHAVFDTVVFVLESVVFALIGLQLPTLVRAMPDRSWTWIAQALVLAMTLVAVRALWVFPLWLVTRGHPTGSRSWRVPAVVSWAGARGVLPLAAALSVPLVTQDGSAFPDRDLILLLTAAVIVVTLVAQGFTLGPLVRRAGIAVPADHTIAQAVAARTSMAQAALHYLDGCDISQSAAEFAVAQLRGALRARLDDATGNTEVPQLPQLRQLRRDLIAIEAAELTRLYEAGEITAGIRRDLQHQLDLEQVSLDR